MTGSSKLCRAAFLALMTLGSAVAEAQKPAAAPKSRAPAAAGAGKLAAIAPVIQQAIRERKMPGAVVLIGHNGRIVYRRAFGYRALVPRRLPMRVDTIFDLASLTKVIATNTAVMQLLEQGKLRLEDPVADYWPEFGANGKGEITVRELMTHYSGLPPDLELEPTWSGYETAMRMIEQASPVFPPGTRFMYSDVNYETLGELVHRLSGEPLNVYCARHIFKPLRMRSTMFLPPASLRMRIAPTQYENGDHGPMLWGVVHDPTARDMGGVAGHAGLFSTGDDLALFAQMLLDGGRSHGVRVLTAPSVDKMTAPQTPPFKMAVRGLGWDIDTPFSSNRGDLFSVGSYGHTGFTGTSIWVDPFSRTYVILLTSAVHPEGMGNVIALRSEIADIAAAAYARMPTAKELAARPTVTSYYEILNSYRTPAPANDKTETGIDVLESQEFAPLAGLRIGLITNQSGRDAAGRRTIDVLNSAPGVKLVAIFSPEHGIQGTADEKVSSSRDAATGLPIYSLYGETNRPADEMLAGLNALVYDIQDAGVRFYTFETTLGYTLESAAHKGLAYFVLDRPDPLGGFNVEGPLLDADQRSFVGYFAEPVRQGMTVGELAQMFNAEQHLGAKLTVIKMRNWHRTDWFDETGLAWANPSPNLRDMTEVALYPGIGMIEGSNVSVGRGTDRPFEVVGAPWVDGKKFSDYLNARRIQGVRFVPADFTPSSSRFSGQVCHGVQIDLVDRDALDSPELGVELSAALFKLFPNDFKLDSTLPLTGSRAVIDGIRQGRDPRRLAYEWEQNQLQAFRRMRAQYLLY
ncbi:MAG TPA: exo-beta-N-acetylmuramidase NamZ domain-containing protein [Terriglobia bacterium]|nr:exo-beta-N-acetylmuramidase NamZ domain-containing protein [Terriglobia bacterium]